MKRFTVQTIGFFVCWLVVGPLLMYPMFRECHESGGFWMRGAGGYHCLDFAGLPPVKREYLNDKYDCRQYVVPGACRHPRDVLRRLI